MCHKLYESSKEGGMGREGVRGGSHGEREKWRERGMEREGVMEVGSVGV